MIVFIEVVVWFSLFPRRGCSSSFLPDFNLQTVCIYLPHLANVDVLEISCLVPGHIQGTGNIPESNASVVWEWWQQQKQQKQQQQEEPSCPLPLTHKLTHTPAAMSGV